MRIHAPDSVRVFRAASWMWLLYLVCQAIIDVGIYAGAINAAVLRYYTAHCIPAVVFLGISYSSLPRKYPGFTGAGLIALISAVPIALNPVLGLKLPQAPLSNIEGMILRQLPTLMIALVLVAWHYSIAGLLTYILGASVLELAIGLAFMPPEGDRALALTFTVIIRAACFLVAGVFVNQLIVLLRSQQRSLEAANQQLTHYASTLEELTVSRERSRMSRELHDTVVHTLSGLSVQLETAKAYLGIDASTAAGLLEQALEATTKGLAETRRALKALRASPLQDLGLLRAIQVVVESAAQRAKLQVDLQVPPHEPALAPDLEQTVYRIVQEAVENVVHHANAQHLVVRLVLAGPGLRLSIEDDGIGFDPAAPPSGGHFGMAGMMERARLIGGKLSVQRRQAGGTRLDLEVEGRGA